MLDLGAACAVILTLASHIAFIRWDERLPKDLGLYYKDLPKYFHALEDSGKWLSTLLDAMGAPGGWYNLALALWLHLVGRSGTAFQVVDVMWLAICLVGTTVVARRIGGSWAGLAASCLVGAMPILVVNARRAWIHVPETALVLLAMLAVLNDPGLSRRRSVALVAVFGGLAVWLRPSGLVWVGTLLPVLWWGVPREQRQGGRIGAVLATWAFCALPALLSLRTYLEAKAAAVERYEEQVPALQLQLAEGFGFLGGISLAVGLLLCLMTRPGPIRILFYGWVVLALGLWAGFRAGIDNFLVLAPALSVLAGVGFARFFKPLALVPVLALLLFHDVQWAPNFFNRASIRQLPGMGQLLSSPHPLNHYRVAWGFTGRWVPPLIDATCPDRTQPCVLVVDQGLYFPYMEEAGRLPLFLIGYDWVELVDLRAVPGSYGGEEVDALVHFAGDAQADQRWRERYPQSEVVLLTLGKEHDLRAAWMHKISSYDVYWFTPGGTLADAEASFELGMTLQRPPALTEVLESEQAGPGTQGGGGPGGPGGMPGGGPGGMPGGGPGGMPGGGPGGMPGDGPGGAPGGGPGGAPGGPIPSGAVGPVPAPR